MHSGGIIFEWNKNAKYTNKEYCWRTFTIFTIFYHFLILHVSLHFLIQIDQRFKIQKKSGISGKMKIMPKKAIQKYVKRAVSLKQTLRI